MSDSQISNTQKLNHLISLLTNNPSFTDSDLRRWLRRYPKDNRGYFSRADLIAAIRQSTKLQQQSETQRLLISRLKLKPTRTLSGVTPVTVLTKPYPCPGKCIFCPNDIRMPKSYIASEPGAQRAYHHHFDPYRQVYSRLDTYRAIGHDCDKVELIILGGTWSNYPKPYQRWFICQIFTALNDFGDGIKPQSVTTPLLNEDSTTSAKPTTSNYNQAILALQAYHPTSTQTATWQEIIIQQHRNQTNHIRCVGLVLETRPDFINEQEIIRLRRYGCTKVQIGLQSLSDRVLKLNCRGHGVATSRRAIRLLRQAGFKIHAHWMPNLYGSSPLLDKTDYRKLFQDPDLKPDELKIYPTSLIDHTELMHIYHQGLWQPYSHADLLDTLVFCLCHTPEYCRITRMVRDIPSPEIVTGNKLTNFRQLVETQAQTNHLPLLDIRHREIRRTRIDPAKLIYKVQCYRTGTTIEYFLQFVTTSNQIAAFLRLSLPQIPSFIAEIVDCSLIREIHVYGQTIPLGTGKAGTAQHSGLGRRLIIHAFTISRRHHYKRIAVISAVGTREYYDRLGFQLTGLYQTRLL